jgi:hypothetical protein
MSAKCDQLRLHRVATHAQDVRKPEAVKFQKILKPLMRMKMIHQVRPQIESHG